MSYQYNVSNDEELETLRRALRTLLSYCPELGGRSGMIDRTIGLKINGDGQVVVSWPEDRSIPFENVKEMVGFTVSKSGGSYPKLSVSFEIGEYKYLIQ